MDVTLVLTHRCNLACGYCYAGEHYKREMDDATMDRALDLLFGDGCELAQLGFFGGEPFLAFERMQRAVAGAKQRAQAAGGQLIVQCTTNGTLLGPEQVAWLATNDVRVTISIDGVREAHDVNRPKAGGGSSFEQVAAGLRAAVAGGVKPDAMMVITPASAPFLFRSVSWLWNEGIMRVRANLELTGRWNLAEREELRQEMVAVGRELLYRHLRGKPVSFDPFNPGLRPPRRPARAAASCAERKQIVVATSGNLYPCAPMVGEDRDTGPEAALRLGTVDAPLAALLPRLEAEGAGCGDGKGCACAAFLETGDRDQAGPNGLWFQKVATEVGAAAAAGLAEARRRAREFPSEELRIVAERPRDHSRRDLLRNIVLGAGGLMLLGGVSYTVLSSARLAVPPPDEPPEQRIAGFMVAQEPPPADPLPVPTPPPDPPPTIAGGISKPPEPPPEHLPVPGEMSAPEPPPRVPPPKVVEPRPDPHVDGDMIMLPEPPVKTRGDIQAPEERTLGKFK